MPLYPLKELAERLADRRQAFQEQLRKQREDADQKNEELRAVFAHSILVNRAPFEYLDRIFGIKGAFHDERPSSAATVGTGDASHSGGPGDGSSAHKPAIA